MTIQTAEAGRAFLDKLIADTNPRGPTVTGWRSLMKRLADHSPELPVSREAYDGYLGIANPAKIATINVQARRYDFLNRFMKSDKIKALGIHNICDDVTRPNKTTLAAPEPELDPQPDAAGVINTADVVEKHLEALRRGTTKARTLRGYRRDLNRLIEAAPTLPATVEQIHDAIGDPDDYMGNTRRKHFAVMHGLFNGPTYQALGLPDPMAGITRPAKSLQRKRVFRDEEIDALLNAGDKYEVAFVRFALTTGARACDAASLTTEWIEDRQVTVQGKGRIRQLPVFPEIADELLSLADEDGVIWRDDKGPMNGERLSNWFRRFAIRAGLTGSQLGSHTLRKTFATRWAMANGGLRQLQYILGHSSLEVTQVYVDVIPEDVRRAHAQFSAAALMGLVNVGKTNSRCGSADPDDVSGVSALEFLPGVAAAAARREAQEQVHLDTAIEYLKRNPCVERSNGRRRKVLKPEIAQLVIQDLEDGYSDSAIVRRFSRVAPFSRAYLAEVKANGRLEEMARSGS